MEAAFIRFVLCLTNLSEVIILELEGTKTIKTWSQLFSLIKSRVGISVNDDKVMEVLAQQQREVLFALTTPAKHRKLMEMEAAMEEEDVKPCRAIVSWLMPTTESSDDPMAIVVANWNKVVDFLKQVQLAVPRLEYSVERMTEDSEACMEEIDAKIMLVQAQVGKPPENFESVPAPDLWNSAVHFKSNLQELQTMLFKMNAGLKDARIQIELQKRAILDSSLLKQQVDQAHAFMGKVYNKVLFTQQEMLKMK